MEQHIVFGSQLDGDKIDRLIRASVDGVEPPTAQLMTMWNGVRIHSGSLDGLRRGVKERLEPGDCRRLEALQIRAGETERRVVVDIGAQAATVTVESIDAAWAIGRGQQLRKILLDARGSWYLRHWCAARLSLAGLAAATTFVALLAIAGAIDGSPDRIARGVLAIIVTTICGFLTGHLRERRNQTALWIEGSIPRRGWTMWTASERIAALSLLVALLALAANVLK